MRSSHATGLFCRTTTAWSEWRRIILFRMRRSILIRMAAHEAMAISDELRNAIRKSGKSLTMLAKESGVPQPMLTRFMNGQDLRLATADKLCSYFGLELRPSHKPKPKGKR